MQSIIQKRKECFKCYAKNDLHSHHIFGGTANRKSSEKYGLKVWLCGLHHNLSNDGVHFDKELDAELKKIGQAKFEETHSREEFMQIFGRNYL